MGLKVDLHNRAVNLILPLWIPLHPPMARDTVAPHQETKDDDEPIRRTVISSSPPSDPTLDHKLQKEILSPITVTPVPSTDTNKDAEKQNPRTKKQKRAEAFQLMALYWSVFYVGCNDGSIGPLVPRIQQVYHVSVLNLCWITLTLKSLDRLYSRLIDFYLLLSCK